MDPSILLLVVTVGLLVMLTMSRRRQQRDQQVMQSQVVAGCEVMTASGMYATVVSVEDSVVVLETGPGQISRWDRRAVGRVLSTPDDATDDGDDDGNDDVGETSGDGETAGGVIPADDVAGTGDDAGRSKES